MIELNTVPETASQLYNLNKYRQNSLQENILLEIFLFMHGNTPV